MTTVAHILGGTILLALIAFPIGGMLRITYSDGGWRGLAFVVGGTVGVILLAFLGFSLVRLQ